MRIISCRIENFGKLHDLDLSFSDGLNVFCRENGWGKSTLAAFIKAMLYGLDGNKKRDLDENERKRFSPWQGGVFGGKMEFEAGQKRYTVTRTFGDSPAKDTFELRNAETNLLSQDYSERLGEELFKLNSASFYRSIFIGQSDCPTVSTDDIHAKIGDLADNTGDMNSFESADERLRKQINALSPRLKSGSLFKLSEEISDLRRRVAEGKNLRRDISECENKIAETEQQKLSRKAERSDLEAQQTQAIKMQELLFLRGEWDRLKDNRENSKKALDEAAEKFPSGIPDEETVKDSIHTAVEMKSAESLMQSYRLSAYEEERLAGMSVLSDSEKPTPEDFDFYFRLEKEYRAAHSQYEKIRLTESETDRLWQLSEAFSQDKTSPSELAAIWNNRVSTKNSLFSKRAACDAIESSAKKARNAAKKRAVVLCTTGCVLISLGITFFFIYSAAWFLSAVILGGLFMSVGIFSAVLIMENFVRKPPEELHQLRREIINDEKFIEETDSVIENYLSAHGMFFTESEADQMLSEICREKRDLEELSQKNEAAEKFRIENNLHVLGESIMAFLKKYGTEPDAERLSDQLHELKEAVAEHELLTEKVRQFESAQQIYHSDRAAIRQFLAAYGFDGNEDVNEALEVLRSDLAEYDRLASLHSAADSELEAFKQSHDIDTLASLDAESIPSPETLGEAIRRCSDSLETLNGSIQSLKQTRDELYRQLALWESDSSALREKTEEQAAEKCKYDRLTLTRVLLRTAKEAMVARYVEPVYSAFRRYHETVTGLSSDRYRIDADVNLTVEELGQQRDIKTLSAGYRDLAGLCLRLGLADAMYRDEKPMLIMDDPFTNLDDEKASASKKLLHAVSQNHQVIYFTCSKTRQ